MWPGQGTTGPYAHDSGASLHGKPCLLPMDTVGCGPPPLLLTTRNEDASGPQGQGGTLISRLTDRTEGKRLQDSSDLRGGGRHVTGTQCVEGKVSITPNTAQPQQGQISPSHHRLTVPTEWVSVRGNGGPGQHPFLQLPLLFGASHWLCTHLSHCSPETSSLTISSKGLWAVGPWPPRKRSIGQRVTPLGPASYTASPGVPCVPLGQHTAGMRLILQDPYTNHSGPSTRPQWPLHPTTTTPPWLPPHPSALSISP